MFAATILLSAGTAGVFAGAGVRGPAFAQESPFARELRVREAAADPASAAWLARALAGEGVPWTATVEGLEALYRALDAAPELDVGPWLGSVRALARAPHPNVRCAAWRVLARAPVAGGEAAPPELGPMPWEGRLERVRAVARAGCDDTALAELCADADPRIADTALAEALQGSPRDDAALAAAWLRAFDAARMLEDERATRLLQMLEFAPDGRELCTRVAELGWLRAEGDPVWRSFHALFLAALARQGGALGEQDLARLSASWSAAWRRHTGARDLLARAARALGAPLGERLAREGCARAADLELAANCFAGAVEALDGNALLRLVAPAVQTRPQLAEPLLDNLRGRVDAWDPEALAPWLAPGVPPSQRAHTVLIVAETFRQNRDAGGARILERALTDPDPEVASEAFQGLAGSADPGPWMEVLHAVWARQPAAWRETRLADLSREIAWTPFRADLIELASQSRAASARAAELLAPFRGDVEVESALREWLEQDLARIRAAPPRQAGAALEPGVLASALSLVRALSLVAGERALPSLLSALEASRERSLELGKGCIYLLGRSEAGRRELRAWLEPPAASRLRAEAALALAPYPGREDALRLLLADYGHYDEDLRMRALRAFAAADDAATERRLVGVARAGDSGAAEVLTAVDCLGQRARKNPALALEVLGWLEEDGLETELRTLCIEELVELGTPEVLAGLHERFRRIEAEGSFAALETRGSQERAFERENLITALARADAILGFEDGLPFELPGARAAGDFQARCRGEPKAEAEFAARPELTLIAAFVRADRLARALDGAAGWRGQDARFLLECAARAFGGGATAPAGGRASPAERLALAAQIGLCGECAVDDSPRVRFEARRLALETARARGDARAFAARGAALLHDLRTGALPYAAFARAWGDFDPRAQQDGAAWMAAEVHVARARAARADGKLEVLRGELALARARAGASRAAREAVEALERELGAGGR